ncbi:hypothetical protein CEXT_610371 [Caerostris extrusa]|uniref:Uncharacterized protein n=1 Tax=Caerostris extrusa TaxID=172846 RepID=A0AAV4SWT0_CAEEX|nr:hypothetical protein CEXT_610371 [Caerostris extrusa]
MHMPSRAGVIWEWCGVILNSTILDSTSTYDAETSWRIAPFFSDHRLLCSKFDMFHQSSLEDSALGFRILDCLVRNSTDNAE